MYVNIFFHNLIFAYVIERLFALERGMTVQYVVYTEIIYAVATALLEIPSGALADRIGRKLLLLLGGIFTFFEFFVLVFAQGFWLFGLSALIAGIGGACTSGAWNALLYDSLKADKKENAFEKILGRVRVADIMAGLFAGLSGSFFANLFGYSFNYRLSCVSAVIAIIPIFLLVEPPRFNSCHGSEPTLRDIAKTAFSFFKKHIDVLRIVAQSSLIVSCVIYVDEFWQIYLNKISFPLVLFGFVSAALTITRTPGALLASKLLMKFSHKTLIVLSSIFATVGILWMAVSKNAWGIAGMAVVCFSAALLEPVSAGYVHRRAESSARATIESAVTMMLRLLSIGAGLIFGYISDRHGIFLSFGMLGITCAASSLWFVLCSSRAGHKCIT